MSEQERLAASPGPESAWRLWGPYLAARQWGTVREDYSGNGDAWGYLSFDQARSRAYRWGEDGIAGICDRHGFLNLAVGMWNGADAILKERYFGLTNSEGNHGEDVKEHWWITDGTPTHSWMSMVYRYPQRAFPYDELRELAARASRDEREPELADTGVLDGDRFFDVETSWAKAGPEDICVTITATNRGPEAAPLHLVPQVWFRNTWSWGRDARRPSLIASTADGWARVVAEHQQLGRYTVHFDGRPRLLVTDNETDEAALFGRPVNPSRYTKAGIGDHIVEGRPDACQVVPMGGASHPGTKAGAWYRFDAVEPGQQVVVRLRLIAGDGHGSAFGPTFADAVATRRREADEFYAGVVRRGTDEERRVARLAFAGLLWTKQHYRFRVREWLEGDPAHPPSPAERHATHARNVHWKHMDVADVLSMPDEWEYPWFAAWDLAFHMVPFALVDPAFAKEQLLLLCREWLMHPDGQLPAYEWEFGDVNPPVHAWATLQVYYAEENRDRVFLARVFHKLLLNFSWWVNRKDPYGNYLFEGGFLGMDNIGPVNRSAPLGDGWRFEQSDATSWMAAYALHLMQMALELARHDEAYEDVATKFVEHYLSIAQASTHFGSAGRPIWDEEDGFCYDLVSRTLPGGAVESQPVRVRSMVGLLPLLAGAPLEPWVFKELPGFAGRLNYLLRRQPAFGQFLTWHTGADGERSALLSLLDERKMRRVLARMFDEGEFLSPHGIRSLSAAHRGGLQVEIAGWHHPIEYEPGESRTAMFGGNSNWRGPVWFPTNALLVQALHALEAFHQGAVTVELPTGSGNEVSAGDAATELSRRLAALFLPGPDGRRPADGNRVESSDSPLWSEHVTFNEYFDGDTGEGLGAAHQTGWTALVAVLLAGWPGHRTA